MNIQGDEPEIDVNDIYNLNEEMKNNKSEIGTLAAKITDPVMLNNENIVKVITSKSFDEISFPLANRFIRKTVNQKNIFHHIGIYSYRTEVLQKFVSLKQSKNEIKNKLEQLRAIDNNMKINVAMAKVSPIGIDTQEDYIAIKK